MSDSIFDSPEGFNAIGVKPSNYSDNIDLDGLSVEDLLALRARIDERLPARALKDISIQEEAVIQFLQIKSLQERVIDSETIPANQKAQVANACASAIKQLDEIQKNSFTFERMKEVENILVDLLNSWPEEMTREFFVQYEQKLGGK